MHEWLHWYYLIFLLPAAVAVFLLLLSGIGGHRYAHARGGAHGHAHVGGAHGQAPGFHGHGHAVGHAGHAHAGSYAGHGHAGVHAGHAGHGHDAHGATAYGHGHSAGHHGHADFAGRQLLAFVGMGRAPITIVVGSLMIGWGVFGFLALEILRPILKLPLLFVGPSLLCAAVGSILTTRLMGELLARVMPQDESYALTRDGLVGLTGKVVYPVTDSEGRVHIFDPYRTLHSESARVAPGLPPIEKGTEVIVASVDPDRKLLIVEPLGFNSKA